MVFLTWYFELQWIGSELNAVFSILSTTENKFAHKDGVKRAQVVRSELSFFSSFFSVFEGKWWLCFIKFFMTDKAVREWLWDEGKWSDSGSDEIEEGRWRKAMAADGELLLNS